MVRCKPFRPARDKGCDRIATAAGYAKTHFSVEDFIGFGERYGIDYRFPALSGDCTFNKAQRIVIRGDVEEMTLFSGLNLTRSDIRVLQPYETTSLHSCPLYMLVVLEGCVMLRLNGQEFVVRAGMAFTSRLSEHQVMNARHLADYHLRTLSLGVDPARCRQSPLLMALLQQWEAGGAPTFLWQVPAFLLSGLHAAQQSAGHRPVASVDDGRADVATAGAGVVLPHAGQRKSAALHRAASSTGWKMCDVCLSKNRKKAYTLDATWRSLQP
ncbi:hypothetical protein CWS02_23160 [Enterobacter sp. EA-1]|nr:hypothetical protein CWS02_23160 [Enterobacter sp. EA-1]